MKFKQYVFLILCAVVLFTACSDETVSFDDQWKLDNEAQFAKITSDPAYTRLESQSGNGYIMYKEIQSGDGESPYFTDQVKVLYTGWYKNIWTSPDTYTDDNGNFITNKVIFDSTENRNNIPSTFTVSGVVDGFSTALQHMQVGDKWEIWIPWILGYGSSGNSGGTIRGYTTLVFEVELVSIVR